MIDARVNHIGCKYCTYVVANKPICLLVICVLTRSIVGTSRGRYGLSARHATRYHLTEAPPSSTTLTGRLSRDRQIRTPVKARALKDYDYDNSNNNNNYYYYIYLLSTFGINNPEG